MPEQAAERTEQPTTRRLSKARGKGRVPQSQELTSIVTLLVLVAMITLLAPNLLQLFVIQIRQGMSCENSIFADSSGFLDFINRKSIDLILVICPILAALCAGSFIASVAVSGLNYTPGALELRLDQFNPVTGLQKLVNARSLVKLLLSVLKLLLISLIVWFYLRSRLDMLAGLRWAWSTQILAVIAKIILGLMIRIGIVLLAMGIADAFYQKWKYIQELKMTKQEVKLELRDTIGSPEVKSRIRKIQFQAVLRRMLQEVPKASVVLVNPTHVAVALRYDAKTMESPVMVAKGADHLAEKIREIARAYGVPIVRRPELARTIYSTVKPGNPIPEALYVVVAEVLAMIYRLRHRKANSQV
ncbi:MAG: EscU/YscU/HrcU family type III secretion system export apparatus switch protein [Planctomycetes bacterium]|nr:EscU/YscU/HrcU family type III secretion system export apparatus switch protein [Planctomycetota bacterium]MCH8118429.1 EscU/YscU/HrcU family type III secretion system export apparatus switch protein [Planctomycetota bacterium]